MSDMLIEVSADIDAPPAVVYNIVADYHVGHPAILPKPYFQSLTVLEGGSGLGTKMRVEMQAMGVKRTMNLVVTDTDPGKSLTEEDAALGVRTVFTFEPLDGGRRTRTTFRTTMRASGGVMGMMERLTTPGITRRIYREELGLLGDYARKQAANGNAA